MSFESGSVTFRLFLVEKPLPRNVVEAFAREAAPPIGRMGIDEVAGWVGGRHALDVPIDGDNARFGGYLRLAWMRAQRKVPSSLFRAHCALEEVAAMKAANKPFLGRRDRSEIRRTVLARLLPQMPPQIRAVPFVVDHTDSILYAPTMSEPLSDVFRAHFLRTTGVGLAPLDAGTAAAHRRRVDVSEWGRTSFSPDAGEEEVNESPGQDFLTWLWFAAEARGGMLDDPAGQPFGFMIEGPLLFEMAGAGAHETVLRRGSPTASIEARAALRAGKKLRRARLTVARGQASWQTTFDADLFGFRSLKLPESPEPHLDPVSRFQERILALGAFRELFFRLFDRFLEDRCDSRRWETCVGEIRAWIASREGRR
jgi:hypothetical protein